MEILCPLSSNSPFPSSASPESPTALSVSGLGTSRTSCKWGHSVCVSIAAFSHSAQRPFSGFIHAVAWDRMSFPFKAEWCSVVCRDHLLLRLFVGEHLGCFQFSSVAQSCPTLCDPMSHSTPGLPVHHQHPEFTQTHVHRVSDAILPSHPLSSPSPPALNPSQHQGLFK